MEVHPPDHPIKNWRDFLIHIATITIGLLIALGLEATVEALHHRHLVHTAHENLRAEMQTNAAVLKTDEQNLDDAQKRLVTDLATLRHLPSLPDKAGARLVADWTWDGLTDSGYKTARDTGAFALMPYEEVQHIDFVYTQQELVDAAANTYIVDLTRIHTPLMGGRTLADASPVEVSRMVDGCSTALIDIELLRALMRTLHEDYRNAAAE